MLVSHFSPPQFILIHSIGQHGVTIFFVLSGFLITTLLLREKAQTSTLSLRSFYLRRLFRIAPSAWTYIAIMFAISVGKPFSGKEISATLFCFRNYVFLNGSHPLTAHFWSLAIEEQFYLVWPLLVLLFNPRALLWLAASGSVLVAIWRLIHWTEIATGPLLAGCATQYRADALLVGCAVAIALPWLQPRMRPWFAIPMAAFVAFCVLRFQGFSPLSESITIAALLATTSSCLTPLNRLLEWKPLEWLGIASYSLYLWQQPLWLIAREWPYGFVIAIPAALALATISYRLIERPCIAAGRQATAAHPVPATLLTPHT